MAGRPLLELDPKWLLRDGRRVGMMFRSPVDPKWFQIVAFEPLGSRPEQWKLADRAVPGCNSQTTFALWTVEGGVEAAEFATLTLSPSVDGSRGGLWHGWIQNGKAYDA